jgi:hypothetical protein
MREFFRVIERVERGREFEPTVGKIREEDIWERKGEKESEENADGEETQVVFCAHLISSRADDERIFVQKSRYKVSLLSDGTTRMNTQGKKNLSGAQKRKKKKEKEELAKELAADVERLKLGPTKLWTGLVLHHKDVFVSHVISKLNETDRFFFAKVNGESRAVLKYAGVNVSELGVTVHKCSSISTLELAWNNMPWGEKDNCGDVIDQAWFCWQVAATNKLELLKWAREVKQCEWDEWPINTAADKGNPEMLKYCFSNGCPYDEEVSCKLAAKGGHLDCVRFLFDKLEPSRETEKVAAVQAAIKGQIDIVKYFVEERKIPDGVKHACMCNTAGFGQLDCLKYLLGEEAKVPLNFWRYVACARYYEHPECVHYLLEKGCPEPSDEQYADFVEDREAEAEEEHSD